MGMGSGVTELSTMCEAAMPRLFLRAGFRRTALAALALGALAGCEEVAEEAAPEARPVRVISVGAPGSGEVVSLSGVIEAKTEGDLSFRIGGRMVERLVNIGDRVAPGQPVARLDPADERNALRSAEASLAAAQGQLVEAAANYERQRQLLERGFTTRQRYDEARQVLNTLRNQADSAYAQVGISRVRLADTELVADAAGVVTERGAEPGEVVTAGRMIVRVARDDGRDAVFDAPPALLETVPSHSVISIALSIDPSVRAEGRVREVAPRADPTTGTFRVRVGLDAAPEAMRLGSIVTGSTEIAGSAAYVLPASALTRDEGRMAVWVVDPATETVALRVVEVADFTPSAVEVTGGVREGDIVVTAGVQALRPGQKVRLLGLGS
jgi:RND family efflux transporter MFP subunit